MVCVVSETIIAFFQRNHFNKDFWTNLYVCLCIFADLRMPVRAWVRTLRTHDICLSMWMCVLFVCMCIYVHVYGEKSSK